VLFLKPIDKLFFMKQYLSVDIGGTKTVIVRLSVKGSVDNAEGKIEESRTVRTGNYGEAEKLLTDIISILKGMRTPDVKGVGIGCGGLIDYERGVVLDWTRHHFVENYPVRGRIEREMGLPVSMRNDVECFAMGEWAFGGRKEKNCESFVGVILGTGIGVCLLLDGKPYKGQHGYAGEVGEFEVFGKTLESYANGAALRELSGIEGDKLYELAKAGDNKALEAFEGYGKRVGAVVRNVFAAYDPEIIVLGGSVAKSFEYFSEAMHKHLKGVYAESVYKNINVVPSMLYNAGLLGTVVPLMK
jgi:glucokinase